MDSSDKDGAFANGSEGAKTRDEELYLGSTEDCEDEEDEDVVWEAQSPAEANRSQRKIMEKSIHEDLKMPGHDPEHPGQDPSRSHEQKSVPGVQGGHDFGNQAQTGVATTTETQDRMHRKVEQGTRRVSIGWLPEQDDRLKIAFAGLVSAVSLNRDKMLATNSDKPSKEDSEWLDKYLNLVLGNVLGLSKDVKPGILPLAFIDSDPAPLAQVWNESVSEEDRERAFGDLFAQSILNIGVETKSSSRRYDARTHRCLRRVSNYLGLSNECIDEYEEMIAGLVTASAEEEAAEQNRELTEQEKKEKARARRWRNFKVGSAAALGAVAVGVTGGLALPAIGASIATFGGVAATTGAFVASAGGTALFTTLFTAGGLHLTGYKMSRRIAANLSEFEFREVPRQAGARRAGTGLHVSIFVSGWTADESRAKRLLERRAKESEDIPNDLAEDLAAKATITNEETLQVRKESEHEKITSNIGDAPRVEESRSVSSAVTNERSLSEVSSSGDQEQTSISSGVKLDENGKLVEGPDSSTTEVVEAEVTDGSAEDIQEEGPMVSGELVSAEWVSLAGKYRAEFGEAFHLVWETEVLNDVSTALKRFAVNKAVSKAVTETLAHTTLAAFMSAIAWPTFVVGAADYIDNSFSVASNRAKLAGEELARAILLGAHGQRPVTLVGYCLGGLVIFHCLQYLAAKKNSILPNKPVIEGLVLDVVILGAPITANVDQWKQIREIVSGELINGYSPSDWILAVLYRSTSLSVSRISGLYTVNCPGVTNINVSSVAKTQVDYYSHLDECMELINKSRAK